MNKRRIVLCWAMVLSFLLVFSSTVLANSNVRTVQAQPINGYKINATAPAVFESLTPDLVEIVRQDGQNVEINLHGEGDGYLAIHYRSGHEFIYHFIIKKDADDVSKFSVHDVAQQVLALVNEERRKAGVAPLTLSPELQSAAAIRAEEITRKLSHTRPDGTNCKTVLPNGRYTMGENIAAGNNTAAKVVQQWMNSTGHRANILRSDYTELGVGYAYKENSQYKHYWVQIFRRPMPGRY
ncbi:MAG: CAP domain-containing protein [Anaerovibrio sp.]